MRIPWWCPMLRGCRDVPCNEDAVVEVRDPRREDWWEGWCGRVWHPSIHWFIADIKNRRETMGFWMLFPVASHWWWTTRWMHWSCQWTMRIPSNILSGVPLVWILLFAAYLSMFGESMIVKGAHMFSRAGFGWFGAYPLYGGPSWKPWFV